MRLWISEHAPILLLFLTDEGVMAGTGGLLTALIVFTLVPRLRHHAILQDAQTSNRESHFTPRPHRHDVPVLKYSARRRIPFYESIESEKLVLLAALLTQGIAMWFVTAAAVHVATFPPDSFYFLSRLPLSYWWGIAVTFAILATRTIFLGRVKTAVEVSSLLLLALYLIGLPSLVYENPRFLDTYFHEGNSIALLTSEKWVGSPVYYLRQFPGAFAYFAMLTSIAAVDPVALMKFYPIALAWLTVLFTYVIARRFAPHHAVLSSGLSVAGLWFQLHLSPQSLDLILYFGILFVFLRIIEDPTKRAAWIGMAVAVIPAFVGAHPTTPLIVALGLAGFLFLSLIVSKSVFLELLKVTGSLTIVFLSFLAFWWYTISNEVRTLVERTIFGRTLSELFQFSAIAPNVPQTPQYSYAFAIGLQQGVSIAIWLLGLFLLLFIRRFRQSQIFLAGLFVAAISAIPLALFGRIDVLQRNYLFSLFPASFLLAWILEKKPGFPLGWSVIYPVLRVGIVALLIVFAVVTPVTRYGADPFHYIPSSSLKASSVVAEVDDRSVLFIRPTEIGWRFFAPFNGSSSAARTQQANITGVPGGFLKSNSDATLPDFNLTFTDSDRSADYIMISDYVRNLYVLRFGANSPLYEDAKSSFESEVTMQFNLVYSTGTDRIYGNRHLG